MKTPTSEVWRDIAGFEGEYRISNFGRVKSLKFGKERIVNPFVNSSGYLQVQLCKNGKTRKPLIHQLIAQAFVPNPEGKSQVNHIDGNRLNNAIDNLEWVSRAENTRHGVARRAVQKELTSAQVEWIRKNPFRMPSKEFAKLLNITEAEVRRIQKIGQQAARGTRLRGRGRQPGMRSLF